MTDETPRSTHGRQEQRRNRDAPSWWGALTRSDLPDDPEPVDGPLPPQGLGRGTAVHPARPKRHARSSTGAGGPVPRPAPAARWRSAGITAATLAVALLVVVVGVGAQSWRGVGAACIIFGVPALLAFVSAFVVMRRSR